MPIGVPVFVKDRIALTLQPKPGAVVSVAHMPHFTAENDTEFKEPGGGRTEPGDHFAWSHSLNITPSHGNGGISQNQPHPAQRTNRAQCLTRWCAQLSWCIRRSETLNLVLPYRPWNETRRRIINTTFGHLTRVEAFRGTPGETCISQQPVR